MKYFSSGWKISVLVFFTIFLLQPSSHAQLTGVKTIPGNYATIEAAITDLNISGVGPGGVTFNVAAGHTETFDSAAAGRIFATGTATNPIVFQKSGAGSNPLITAALNGTGDYDGIIVLAGTDYITFDGISLRENAGNLNAITQMEWGYALLKKNLTAPSDGCQYVTIKNCSLSLNNANANTAAIFSAHRAYDGTTVIPGDSLDATNHTKIFSNYITSTILGIRLFGSSNVLYYDKYNEIGVDGGNQIIGYGGNTATARAIYIEYQNYLKVANNIIVGDGSGSLYGISCGSGSNCNGDFYNNNIKLTSVSSSIVYSLSVSLGSSGVDNTVNIYNNIIDSSSQTVTTSNSWWAIYMLGSAKTTNIYGNIVRNVTKMGGPLYCLNINPSAAQDVNIYDNHFYNCSSGGSMYGISVSATGATLNIQRNTINNLSNPAAATGVAVYGISVTAALNTYFYNNFISDLTAPSANSADAVRGISISNTTAGTNIGLYYNSIFLNASSSGGTFGTSGIYTAGSSTAANGALDMRNNIVINKSIPNGTGKTAAYRRSSTLIANFAAADNNCYYAGTPGVNNVIFYDGTNFDQTLAAYKTRVTPKEAASISENVPFVNSTTAPYNLHIDTTVVTQLEGGGTPVTTPIAITTDFDNQTRNLVTPDIGADEFVGQGGDLTAPQINYTALTHTTSTTNRTLSAVAIADGSGVNVTPGTAPRIYFKRTTDNNTFVDNSSGTNGWKYVQTSGTVSPYDFTMNYSLLYDGSGALPGDTIQYFVVAQDLATIPNVGIQSGTFAAMPSSVNLSAAAFPITGTINSYRIQYILNGAITVGTGGNYNTLTGPMGLFNIMNENIVSGNLTVQIISNLIEPGTFGLDPWVESGAGNYNVVIQPNSAVLRTISGSSANGLIRLIGADRVTIDGRYGGAGNYLLIQNTSTAVSTAAIHVGSLGAGAGTSDITIRNCNIKAGTDSSSSTFGIFFGGASVNTGGSGADFQNTLITENFISKCAYGIFIHGVTANPATNLMISNNTVGSDVVNDYVTYYGINVQAADAPVVTMNHVYNLIFSSSRHGLWFGSNVSDAVVTRNKVHSMNQTGTTGYNTYAIHFSSSTGCSDNLIANNMVYDINTYGNTSLWLNGIRIIGGTNYKVYNNSVSISGTFPNPAADLPSTCLAVTTATTNIDLRDNIFSNTRQGTTPKNYAVYTVNTTTFQSMDFNDYWTTGPVMGYFGADVVTLADWKTAVGRDTSSVWGDPLFISNIDLHIQGGAGSPVSNTGITIAGVTTDIDGDLRNNPPDIGADEFSDNPTTFPLTVNVAAGWNMVSVPGLLPTNQNVTSWWPGKDPAASVFKFNSGYQPVTVAVPGIGYWMKNLNTQTYNTGDEWPAGGINIVAHNPIAGFAGWNMIGGYEQTVNTAGLTTTPPDLITGTIYKYTPGSGYQAATQLVPGFGYWVKLTAAGSINVPLGAAGPSKLTAGPSTEGFGKITLTDASLKSYTLYTVQGQADLSQFDLPPYPPQGMFDVRYSSQRYAEKLSTSQTIEMTGVEYPVKIEAEEVSIIISDETGKEIARLKAGEEVSVTTSGKLMVTQNIIPAVYSLEQNYPNPFNPSTTIQFSIPEDVQNVKLIVYSSLGEKIAELVNAGLTAGIYKINWNASNVASGLYIYQVVTDKFVSTKKMMLLK